MSTVVTVTGASGHIGANLVRALLEHGHQVRATVYRDARALEDLDVERVEADVLDVRSIRRAIDGAELVYHLAAVISITGDPDGQMRRVNVEGTRNVARACIEAGVKRMVHFSSIHAFSPRPESEPIDEHRGPAEPDSMAYDQTKAAGEREVLAAVERGLDGVILNPTSILGPHDYKPSLMGQVLLDLHRGKFPALVDGGFDWVDVRDVVQAALVAATKGRRGERHLLSGKWASFKELASLVGQTTGVPVPRFVAPMWLARLGAPFMVALNSVVGKRPLYTSSSLRALRCHRRVVSGKAQELLAFRPRPLRQTIEETFAWLGEAGMLA